MATPIAFSAGVETIINEGVNSLSFKVLLLDDNAGYTLTDNDGVVADIVSAELVSNGYSRKALGNVAVNVVAGEIRVSASAVVWPTLGGVEVVSAVVIFVDTGNDATSTLVAGTDGMGGMLNGAGVTIAFPAAGWSRWIPDN